MKKLITVAVLAMGFVAVQSRAQTDIPAPAATPAPAADQAAPVTRQMPSPDKIVAMMATKLNLTPEQQQKITPIVAARQAQMQSIRADTSARPMQRMKKAKAATEEADKQINAILTPDQQTQYAAFEAQMKEQMKERREEQKSATN